MSRLPHMLFNLPLVDEDEVLLFVLPRQAAPAGDTDHGEKLSFISHRFTAKGLHGQTELKV